VSMGVRLFPAVHGHIADSVRDHEPRRVVAVGGSTGPRRRKRRSTERLILSAAVVIRSGERHARHERSPVIAGSSPRISCRTPPTGAASLGPDRSMSSRSHARRNPVVHTVISPEGGGTPSSTVLTCADSAMCLLRYAGATTAGERTPVHLTCGFSLSAA